MGPEIAAQQVAVVVATLGKSPVLRRALLAIEQQQEIAIALTVVTQGNLSDGTSAAIAEIADHHISAPKPLGFAKANNLALQKILTEQQVPEYVALINDDAIISDDWLNKIVACLKANPAAGSAQGHNLSAGAGHTAKVDGTGIEWNHRLQAVQVDRGRPAVELTSSGEPVPRFGVSATAAVYRSAALIASKTSAGDVFDEQLNTYYEDVDLACRLRQRGWEALFVPDARCEHSESSSAPGARQRLLLVNRHLVLARHLGRSYLLKLPRLALRDAVDFGLGAVAGWVGAAAKLPGFLHWGRAMRLRQWSDR